MIICICANVNEQAIKKCASSNLTDIMLETGAGMQCGYCFDELKSISKNLGDEISPVLNNTTVRCGLSAL